MKTSIEKAFTEKFLRNATAKTTTTKVVIRIKSKSCFTNSERQRERKRGREIKKKQEDRLKINHRIKFMGTLLQKVFIK